MVFLHYKWQKLSIHVLNILMEFKQILLMYLEKRSPIFWTKIYKTGTCAKNHRSEQHAWQTWAMRATVLLNTTLSALSWLTGRPAAYTKDPANLETVQDFLIKLGIKPLMHLLEISIFSLNNDIVRLTKIMNNLVKDIRILSFKVIFQCLKFVESFQFFFSVKNIWLGDQLTLMNFFENSDF